MWCYLKTVSVYSLIHAIIDFSCAFVMSGLMMASDNIELVYIGAILYNFLAFALQFPVGIFADKWNKNRYVSIIGCALVSVGVLFSLFVKSYFIFIPILFIGLGNAFFHIGGGIDILNISKGKATLPGIYVSTGALGLFLGAYLELGFMSSIIVFSLLMVSIILLLNLDAFEKLPNNEVFKIEKRNINQNLILLLLFSAVCLRSFTGFAVGFDWKNSFSIALLSTICVVAGKMLGGIVGDKFGWGRVSNISLLIASGLFIFAPTNMICGLLGLLLFNMTMPLTLTALSNTFPNSKGAAFGLTTVALFVGYIVEMWISPIIDSLNGGLVLFVCGLLSLVVMYFGLNYYKKNRGV